MRRVLMTLAAVAAGAALTAPAARAQTAELLGNPGVEAEGDLGQPASWTKSSWGDCKATFSWSATGAHSGSRSLRVDVSAGTPNNGDAKWQPDPVAVKGNTYYTISDWYRSNVSSAISVNYRTASDTSEEGTWANLYMAIPPASEWTQYTTGFTMPADATEATFVHFIARPGYLQTDDSSLKESEAPAGFSRPLISLTFDDGSKAFFDNARPLLQPRGIKTTQYVPTGGLVSSPPDEFMMTTAELRQLSNEGHEIGSHSISHPDLADTKLVPDAALANELKGSKSLLDSLGIPPVTSFAYPYGSYDARVVAATSAAGYATARSVEDGYNGKFDLEPYDLRGQNMLSTTTLAIFKSWVDYAKAHNYWLIVIYHEVVPDTAPACTDPVTVSPCLGPYDTTIGRFRAQLDYLAAAGVAQDVMTVRDAMTVINTRPNAEPKGGTVTLTSSAPATGDPLTAAPAGFSDPDGDTLTYEYRWLVGGREIAGATGPTLDLSRPGYGDHGDEIVAEVSASDGHGHTTAVARASATVRNSPPQSGAVAVVPAAPAPGATLVASPSGFSDPDGDPLRYSYAWSVNGRPAGGDTATLTGYAGVAGDTVRVAVRASDDHGGTGEPVVAVAKLAADTTAPRIVVTSPRAHRYRTGTRVAIRFSGTDAGGLARTSATLRRRGAKTRTVRNGTKVRLTRPGTYVLRVSATDRAGNRATRTVTFRVVRR